MPSPFPWPRPATTPANPIHRPWRPRLEPWLALPPLLALAVLALTLALAALWQRDPAHPAALEPGARLHTGQLVPPLPLPPSAFTRSHQPALASADRDWTRLAPEFTRSVLTLLGRMAERGYQITLVEGYRSPERQAMLASSGRNVTRAAAAESLHQYGLAADLAPMRDGVLALSSTDPWTREAYRVLGEEAEALGLVWGGRWTFQDLGHVEANQAAASRPWKTQSPPPTPFTWKAR